MWELYQGKWGHPIPTYKASFGAKPRAGPGYDTTELLKFFQKHENYPKLAADSSCRRTSRLRPLHLWQGLGAPMGGFQEWLTANSGSCDNGNTHNGWMESARTVLPGIVFTGWKRGSLSAWQSICLSHPPLSLSVPLPPFLLSISSSMEVSICGQYPPALRLDLGQALPLVLTCPATKDSLTFFLSYPEGRCVCKGGDGGF